MMIDYFDARRLRRHCRRFPLATSPPRFRYAFAIDARF